MNKKILLSLLIIGVIASVASAGTWAYFSDAKDTDSSTLTSGKLTLGEMSELTITNNNGHDFIVPGDTGEGSVSITNTGNVPGDLYVKISRTGNLASPLITYTAAVGGTSVTVGDEYVYVASLDAEESTDLTMSYQMPTTVTNEGQDKVADFHIDVVLSQSGIGVSQLTDAQRTP